tara:strand:+ start:32977 stop:33732 length:756 start_codon:yes stop_codon:yes gene_type:complete
MKIVVIGGTGLIGSKTVYKLRSLGHDVLVASPDTGVNTITGQGLSQALKGAQKVVDVANSPSFEDKAVMEFFETSGRNLLAAEAIAGVKHHIALSIVGAERLPNSGYMRAKVAQEKLIKESHIPFSILHSTQFFEFAGGIVKDGTKGDKVYLSSSLFQPISSDDVVDALVDVIVDDPINGILEVGGPEKIGMDKFAQIYMNMKKDDRQVIGDSHTLYFGSEISDVSLLPGAEARTGSIRYEDWIRIPGNLR